MEEHPREALKTDPARNLATVPEVDSLLRWMERATDGMNAYGAAVPESKERRRETNRARLETIRTRRTPPLWPENVWLVGRDLANALPVPVAGDEWFDVEGCRNRPRMRWRALALRCAEEDVEAEAARYVGGCIGSHMAGFPDKPSAEELIGALRAGAVTGRQRTIVEGLFAGMDAGSARRRRRGPS